MQAFVNARKWIEGNNSQVRTDPVQTCLLIDLGLQYHRVDQGVLLKAEL
jgi:hypothetical protein